MQQFEQVEILLAEDSARDAELAMRALKKGGVENKLMWVKDGEQALDYLFRRGMFAAREDVPPRLVLLDLKMPRVDGIEVLEAVKTDRRTRRIPVVVMTSSREEKDLALSYDLGVNSYIVKPLEFADLADLVRQAGFYWLAINRTPAG